MKKIMSLLLALTIMLSMMTFITTTGVSAASVYTFDNLTKYDYKTDTQLPVQPGSFDKDKDNVDIKDQPNITNVSLNTNTKYAYGGKGKSLKVFDVNPTDNRASIFFGGDYLGGVAEYKAGKVITFKMYSTEEISHAAQGTQWHVVAGWDWGAWDGAYTVLPAKTWCDVYLPITQSMADGYYWELLWIEGMTKGDIYIDNVQIIDQPKGVDCWADPKTGNKTGNNDCIYPIVKVPKIDPTFDSLSHYSTTAANAPVWIGEKSKTTVSLNTTAAYAYGGKGKSLKITANGTIGFEIGGDSIGTYTKGKVLTFKMYSNTELYFVNDGIQVQDHIVSGWEWGPWSGASTYIPKGRWIDVYLYIDQNVVDYNHFSFYLEYVPSGTVIYVDNFAIKDKPSNVVFSRTYEDENGIQKKTTNCPVFIDPKAANTAELKTLLEKAEGLIKDKSKYQADTITNLEKVAAEAKTVYEKRGLTQTEADAASKKLMTAINAVKTADGEAIPVDTTLLLEKIEIAKAMEEFKDNYKPETYASVVAALEAAEAVMAKADKTQEQVDAAYTALKDALDAAETEHQLPADKSILESAITAAQALKEEEYTAESWATMKQALDAAKVIFEDEANQDQAQVDAAITALNDAVAALKKLENGQTNNGGEDTKPGDETNKGGMPWWIWVIIGVVVVAAAGGASFFVIKSKKKAPVSETEVEAEISSDSDNK